MVVIITIVANKRIAKKKISAMVVIAAKMISAAQNLTAKFIYEL